MSVFDRLEAFKAGGEQALVLRDTTPADRNAATAEAISTWALGEMAYYKVPGWIAFVDDLPRTPTEKILRAALKTQVVEAMARGAFFDLRALKRRQV